ncbi:MAG: small-conductance mechanosensitive channel [Candidatus Latescibacterota bacterium]|jgi:small-conductance mechanosensitive channel
MLMVMLGVSFFLFVGERTAWAQGDSVGADVVGVAVVAVDSVAADSSVVLPVVVDSPVSDTTVALAIEKEAEVQAGSARADSVSGGVGKKATQQLSETAGRLGNIFSLGNIVAALFIWLGTYLSVRIMTWLIGIASGRFGQYRLKLMMLVPIVRILMWSGALYLVVTGVFSPSTDKLFAFAASAGLAIGFASQDVLKNIFGGLLIILDRPFQVGDKIQVGSHYGEVVNIGLRSVRIVTPDDSLVSVPNAELVNQAVSNANAGALDCQVAIELYLPFDVDIRYAKKIAYEAAATSRFVYLNKPIVVMVQDMYDKGFLTKLKVKAYVLDTRYEFAFASDVSERAKAAFVDAGFYGLKEITI